MNERNPQGKPEKAWNRADPKEALCFRRFATVGRKFTYYDMT